MAAMMASTASTAMSSTKVKPLLSFPIFLKAVAIFIIVLIHPLFPYNFLLAEGEPFEPAFPLEADICH
jgi:hypothetical protein